MGDGEAERRPETKASKRTARAVRPRLCEIAGFLGDQERRGSAMGTEGSSLGARGLSAKPHEGTARTPRAKEMFSTSAMARVTQLGVSVETLGGHRKLPGLPGHKLHITADF